MPDLLPESDDIAPHEVVFLVSEEADGGFVAAATCASICTQADSWDELRAMAREAVQCHYGDDAHPVIHLRLEGTEPDA
jgi:predicted RNase H-like HicB family nuclease